MRRFTKAPPQAPVLTERARLVKDIELHLVEFRPELFEIFPRPYLGWVINDGVEIASHFKLNDVEALRVFVRLRWDIAPGFYKQPTIAAVLSRTELSGMARFEELASERYADDWIAAARFNDAREWRARFWGADI